MATIIDECSAKRVERNLHVLSICIHSVCLTVTVTYCALRSLARGRAMHCGKWPAG